MSSAANHKKRSCRSAAMKGGAFRARDRRIYINAARESGNRSVLGQLAKAFHRRARRPREKDAGAELGAQQDEV